MSSAAAVLLAASASAPDQAPSSKSTLMERLLKRADFLSAAKAPSSATPGVIIQARKKSDHDATRVGFTCTKKLGNAVARNRIRRRLKEAARQALPTVALPSYDYVLIGRAGTETRPFEELRKDIISALNRLHAGGGKTFPPRRK